MLRFTRAFAALGLAALVTTGVAMSPDARAESWPTESECRSINDPSIEVKGWCTAINRRQGNCLGCHTIMVNPWPEGFPPGGNVAPPLVAMKQRFPDRDNLRARIYDATEFNKHSRMPPFGAHGILSDEQIDAIVAFLLTI